MPNPVLEKIFGVDFTNHFFELSVQMVSREAHRLGKQFPYDSIEDSLAYGRFKKMHQKAALQAKNVTELLLSCDLFFAFPL